MFTKLSPVASCQMCRKLDVIRKKKKDFDIKLKRTEKMLNVKIDPIVDPIMR